jgi:hypothetical protein
VAKIYLELWGGGFYNGRGSGKVAKTHKDGTLILPF